MPDTLQQNDFSSDDHLLSLRSIYDFLLRRRLVIATSVLCFFCLGVLYYALATKRYMAETLIEIKRPTDALGLGSLVPGTVQAPEEGNPLEEDVNVATKVQELQSDEIDLQVIDQLRLQDTPDFKPKFNPIGWFLNLFAAPSRKDAAGTPFMKSPHRRAAALAAFQKHLKVQAVPSTRLISISYLNPDPELAAAVANALANELEQNGYAAKQQSTTQLSSWLGTQLRRVRTEANALEEQEAKLRRETESYSIGGTNAAGQTTVYSPVLDALQQSTTALTGAEANRILRGAVDRVVQSGDPTLISGLAGSGVLGNGSPQSATSLTLITSLQTQEAQLQLQLSQDELRFGDKYPKLIEERAQVASIEASLQDETNRLAKRAANDYAISKAEEDRTRAEHDALIKQASDINDKFLQYEVIRQQAQDARQLYTDLNRRLLGAGITATAQAGDMSVISAAFAPDKPGSPKLMLVLAGSIFMGVLAGALLALLVEGRDDNLRSSSAIEKHFGLPIYAEIPESGSALSGRSRLWQAFGRTEPNSVKVHDLSLGGDAERKPGHDPAEAFRALRTTILLSDPAKAIKTVLFTSSSNDEGRTAAAVGLAATYARAGQRTLLVEIDLHKPTLAVALGLQPSREGLSTMLKGQLPAEWGLPVQSVPNLVCIPGGEAVFNAYDLLSSVRMTELLSAWREAFDVIILDGPPLLKTNDSLLISAQVDLLLIAARCNESSISALRQSHDLLTRLARVPVGAIISCAFQADRTSYAG